LGTVNYMSPEQAKGERVDERTDIFSLGVVIYEMVARRPPFASESKPETFANLINAEPPPLGRFATNVPAELTRIVSKTLRKKRDERYQTMKDLLADLKELKQTIAFDEKVERAASVNSSVSQVLQNSTDGATRPAADTQDSALRKTTQRPLAVGLSLVLLVGAIVFGLWYFKKNSSSGKKQIESIAVMPFVNDSGNAELEYLSDGLTETLISSLSQLPNLDVKAHSSVFRYKGKNPNANTIAKELNVQAFLNGKVRQRGSDLSFYVELVDATTEKAIWSQTYDRSMTNLVSLQGDIARDVATKLRVKLSGVEEQELAKTHTANRLAYELYLKGNFHVGKRTEKDIRKGIEYLEQAIAADRNYALAYAGLASAYIALPNYSKVPWSEVMPKVREATSRALALDSDLSDAHVFLGFVMIVDGDDGGAEREYQRAIDLNPNSGLAFHFLCQLRYAQGRLEEALNYQRQALEIDPLSLIFNREYASKLFWSRRYDEAIAQFRKTIELEPGFPSAHYGLALAHQMKGNYAESVEEQAKYQELIGEPNKAALLRESFAKAGWHGFLRTIIDERHQIDLSWDSLVPYYAALGDKDKAFVFLRRRFENRKIRLGFLLDPRLDPLRDDPRFDEFVKRSKS